MKKYISRIEFWDTDGNPVVFQICKELSPHAKQQFWALRSAAASMHEGISLYSQMAEIEVNGRFYNYARDLQAWVSPLGTGLEVLNTKLDGRTVYLPYYYNKGRTAKICSSAHIQSSPNVNRVLQKVYGNQDFLFFEVKLGEGLTDNTKTITTTTTK